MDGKQRHCTVMLSFEGKKNPQSLIDIMASNMSEVDHENDDMNLINLYMYFTINCSLYQVALAGLKLMTPTCETPCLYTWSCRIQTYFLRVEIIDLVCKLGIKETKMRLRGNSDQFDHLLDDLGPVFNWEIINDVDQQYSSIEKAVVDVFKCH